LLFAIPVVAAVPLIAWFGLPRLSTSSDDGGPIMHAVQRGNFIHDVTEHGNVESANNVEIRCEVESHGAGTMIIWIVPEGTYVKPAPDWEPSEPGEEPPDLLVKLDSSSLEDKRIQQQIVCNSSKAAVTQAENNFKTAVIAKEEYLEGTYLEQKKRLEGAISLAEEELVRAEQYLTDSQVLHAKGFISDRELQTDELELQRKRIELERATTEMEVLEKYTKPKRLLTLDADINVAQARLDSEKHSHKLDLDKLEEYEEQIAKCTIRAPQPGQVVYANVTDRRGGQEIVIEEGTMIRERQEIIRLPDPENMQVKAKINEARVSAIEDGMPARIELDAFPDMKLTGTVEKVSEYPLPTSWFAGNVKEYETIVKIDSFPKDLEMRPGMTAKVSIRVEQLDDVLTVPVQAVFEHGSKHYCVFRNGDQMQARQVSVGSSNDKEVVITEGLEAGDQVVLGAALYREDLGLPEIESEGEKEIIEGPGAPANQLARAGGKTQPSGPGRGSPPGGPPGPGGARPKAPGGPGGFNPAQIFQQRDADGNGRLEGDEIASQMKANLSQIDANNDGAVDRGEFNTAIQRMMRMRGGAGAKPEGPGGPPGPRAKRKPDAPADTEAGSTAGGDGGGPQSQADRANRAEGGGAGANTEGGGGGGQGG
jgi:RND family efflux transporter MFP subunit